MFQPTAYLEPKSIKYEDKTIIHIHVPQSSEVHSFKKILNYMEKDREYKTAEIAEVIGLKEPQTRGILNEFVAANKMEMVGTNKNRAYRFI